MIRHRQSEEAEWLMSEKLKRYNQKVPYTVQKRAKGAIFGFEWAEGFIPLLLRSKKRQMTHLLMYLFFACA